MTGEDIIKAAIAIRTAQGLTVIAEKPGASESYIRHCKDVADRDAYIARCKARGETTSIVEV